jgi:hypothetical protein
MRARLTSLILLGCAYALTSEAETDALQSKVDAYINQVGQIVAQALMPELAKHRELGNVRKTFSFRIDAGGHPSQIKATSIPSTELLDHLVVKIIRGLKFPRLPKDILAKYENLEFRTEMGPPGSLDE